MKQQSYCPAATARTLAGPPSWESTISTSSPFAAKMPAAAAVKYGSTVPGTQHVCNPRVKRSRSDIFSSFQQPFNSTSRACKRGKQSDSSRSSTIVISRLDNVTVARRPPSPLLEGLPLCRWRLYHLGDFATNCRRLADACQCAKCRGMKRGRSCLGDLRSRSPLKPGSTSPALVQRVLALAL